MYNLQVYIRTCSSRCSLARSVSLRLAASSVAASDRLLAAASDACRCASDCFRAQSCSSRERGRRHGAHTQPHLRDSIAM